MSRKSKKSTDTITLSSGICGLNSVAVNQSVAFNRKRCLVEKLNILYLNLLVLFPSFLNY
jgi:hypothetical protein